MKTEKKRQGPSIEELLKLSEPKPLTPMEAYLVIIEWLYQSDRAYPSAIEWRKALVRHLVVTLKRIKSNGKGNN